MSIVVIIESVTADDHDFWPFLPFARGGLRIRAIPAPSLMGGAVDDHAGRIYQTAAIQTRWAVIPPLAVTTISIVVIIESVTADGTSSGPFRRLLARGLAETAALPRDFANPLSHP